MKWTPESFKIPEDAHPVIPLEPTAVYNRSCYLACLNRYAEAICWVKKPLGLNPKLRPHADLQAIRHRLESLVPLVPSPKLERPSLICLAPVLGEEKVSS